MAWLESHQSLGDHPKTKKLCRLLRISKREAVGTLHILWWWALDYAEDGDLTKYELMDIAIGADWDGAEGEFVDALVTAGFLDRDENGLRIHDWHDYAGKLIERRERNAQRMRDARAGYDAGTDDERATHVQGTQHARVQLQNQPTIPNQPNPAVPTEPDQPTNQPFANGEQYSDEFQTFWNHYPRKIKKDDAWRAWKSRKDRPPISVLVASIDEHKRSVDWTKDGGKYIPHPATWLRGGCWKDELPPGPLQLPPGVDWRDVEEWRNRVKGGYPISDEKRQLLTMIDRSAAA